METCEGVIACASTMMPALLDAVFAVIAAASAIAALTRTPSDDHWIGKIYRLVDLMALNVGHAKETPKSAGGRFVPD